MKADTPIPIKEKLFHHRPHVMEKILLGVTGVRPEMRGGEVAQFLFRQAPAGNKAVAARVPPTTSTGNAESKL